MRQRSRINVVANRQYAVQFNYLFAGRLFCFDIFSFATIVACLSIFGSIFSNKISVTFRHLCKILKFTAVFCTYFCKKIVSMRTIKRSKSVENCFTYKISCKGFVYFMFFIYYIHYIKYMYFIIYFSHRILCNFIFSNFL